MGHALNIFYCRGALGTAVNQISSDACAPAEKSASRNAVNLARGRKYPAKYEKAKNEKRQTDKIKNNKLKEKKKISRDAVSRYTVKRFTNNRKYAVYLHDSRFEGP